MKLKEKEDKGMKTHIEHVKKWRRQGAVVRYAEENGTQAYSYELPNHSLSMTKQPNTELVDVVVNEYSTLPTHLHKDVTKGQVLALYEQGGAFYGIENVAMTVAEKMAWRIIVTALENLEGHPSRSKCERLDVQVSLVNDRLHFWITLNNNLHEQYNFKLDNVKKCLRYEIISTLNYSQRTLMEEGVLTRANSTKFINRLNHLLTLV